MKIKINERLFGILSIIIFCIFLGSFLSSISAILFGEVPTKLSGVREYTFEEAITMFISSIFFGIIFYLFSKYIEPKTSEKNEKGIQYTKCPKCKEVFESNNLKDNKCKYCKDIDTIDLDEYFELSPKELTKRKKTK